MSNPSVCCTMLVNGRPEMVTRAIRSFEAQTYKNKWLTIYDTSDESLAFNPPKGTNNWDIHQPAKHGATIGELRNEANAETDEDILVHWDSDDWSHPRRIEEQVALLQASGKECVGYRDMLFWREASGPVDVDPMERTMPVNPGEAWLYTGGPNYCLGTSFCYWRSVWEKRPFEDLPKHATGSGEDTQWLRGVDHMGVSSLVWKHPDGGPTTLPSYSEKDPPEPRMIASIHGGNTSSMVSLAIKVGDSMIKRVPALDAYCRDKMQL